MKFETLYGQEAAGQRARYRALEEGFAQQYGDAEGVSFYSAPGRTEIGGNHTDHNHGHVLAAAVNLDIAAAARKTQDGKIYLKSKEYEKADTVDLSDLSRRPEESESSYAMIKGICARCRELGYRVEGFEAYTITRVLKGSGLSSSASFEILLVTIISQLFNDGQIDPVTAAMIAQYAENVYFGKPSGLMDQMASSVGGVVSIDFQDESHPKIRKVDFDLNAYDHALCVVDTGGNHADLTNAYAEIPQEMKAVAAYFGKSVLRELEEETVLKEIPKLRSAVGDRAILRSLHFFEDDRIAAEEAEALDQGDFQQFLDLVNRSGDSSETRLQNVFANVNPSEQGLSLALALSKRLLGKKAACRVHGGGFAGTIQAFVPLSMLSEYRKQMEAVFGEGSCYLLSFRGVGGVKVEL